MKGNAKKELHTKTKEELLSLIKDLKKEIAQAIVQLSSNKEKNVHIIHQKKKALARILTLYGQKERINA